MAQAPIIVNSGGGLLSNLKTIGILAGGAFIVWQGKKYLDKVAADKQLQKDQQSTISVKPGKKLFDLMGRPIKSANLSVIAADINDGLSWPTDNARVVRVFQTTPFGYVPALEKFYLDKYGKDLKSELVSKLKDQYWISIKYNFR